MVSEGILKPLQPWISEVGLKFQSNCTLIRELLEPIRTFLEGVNLSQCQNYTCKKKNKKKKRKISSVIWSCVVGHKYHSSLSLCLNNAPKRSILLNEDSLLSLLCKGKELVHLMRCWDTSLHVIPNSLACCSITFSPRCRTGGSYGVWPPYQATRCAFSRAPLL